MRLGLSWVTTAVNAIDCAAARRPLIAFSKSTAFGSSSGASLVAGRAGDLAALAGAVCCASAPPPTRARLAASSSANRENPGWFMASLRSRKHSTFEHLVCDRRRDSVDERSARRRIIAQERHGLLFLGRLWRVLRRPQLFAGRALVLADHLVGDHVENGTLGDCRAADDEGGKQGER